ILPPFAVYKNPIDLTGSADTRMYVESMKILMEDENVHGVVLIALHHPPLISFDLPEKIAEVIRNYDKPVVACDVGEAEMSKAFRKKFDSHNIPAYPSPERASRAMYALVKYGEYRCKVLEYE
ncbi:CoA-binding protein, partial [archaeon]